MPLVALKDCSVHQLFEKGMRPFCLFVLWCFVFFPTSLFIQQTAQLIASGCWKAKACLKNFEGCVTEVCPSTIVSTC